MKGVNLVSGIINSKATEMDDNEDSETIEIIQQPIVKKNSKKQKPKKKNRYNNNNINSSI